MFWPPSISKHSQEERLCLWKVPYLPMYKSIPCISRPTIFDGKKRNFLISLLNVHGTLILYSSISGNVDTQKNQGLKGLIVLLFSSCCICGHFVLEFRKSFHKIEDVNLNSPVSLFKIKGLEDKHNATSQKQESIFENNLRTMQKCARFNWSLTYNFSNDKENKTQTKQYEVCKSI